MCSATIIVGRFVVALGTVGMIEASRRSSRWTYRPQLNVLTTSS
jgi:hypothetical protein